MVHDLQWSTTYNDWVHIGFLNILYFSTLASASRATLQAELAMQKDANVEISKTETDEDDNTLYYIGGAVAGVIGLIIMT